MHIPMIGRRGLAALAATVLFAACAPGAMAAVRTPDCEGVTPVPGPTEPLIAVTAKGRTAFSVEIAANDDERERGLMCRRTLAPDKGMLFDFQTPRQVAFWMKNTLIPLDIVYIRQDGRVLSIARNAMPLDERPLPSGGETLGVLELAGGRAAQIGLRPGDRIEHRIFPRD
jgi:uncharacterized membrane protein (UPF0127 family)